MGEANRSPTHQTVLLGRVASRTSYGMYQTLTVPRLVLLNEGRQSASPIKLTSKARAHSFL